MSQNEETSRRVDQVVALAAAGATDREIAEQLKISPYTVATYWKRLRATWNVSKRGTIILCHLRDSLERANKELELELSRREEVESELLAATEELKNLYEKQRLGWNSELTSTQARLYDAANKAEIVDRFDLAIACGGAIAYELAGISPIVHRFIRFDPDAFGISPGDVVNGTLKFYDIVCEEDLAAIFELSKDVPTSPDRRTTFVYRQKCPEPRWLMDTQQPYVNEAGAILGISGVAIDIHDLVLAGWIPAQVARHDRPAKPIVKSSP